MYGGRGVKGVARRVFLELDVINNGDGLNILQEYDVFSRIILWGSCHGLCAEMRQGKWQRRKPGKTCWLAERGAR